MVAANFVRNYCVFKVFKRFVFTIVFDCVVCITGSNCTTGRLNVLNTNHLRNIGNCKSISFKTVAGNINVNWFFTTTGNVCRGNTVNLFKTSLNCVFCKSAELFWCTASAKSQHHDWHHWRVHLDCNWWFCIIRQVVADKVNLIANITTGSIKICTVVKFKNYKGNTTHWLGMEVLKTWYTRKRTFQGCCNRLFYFFRTSTIILSKNHHVRKIHFRKHINRKLCCTENTKDNCQNEQKLGCYRFVYTFFRKCHLFSPIQY